MVKQKTMAKKIRNLQPWLDYFEMLQTYEKSGYLEFSKDENEVFVTDAALATLADADHQWDVLSRTRAYKEVARRIHAYSAWRKRRGYDYMQEPFALHVVKADGPHDLKVTLLMTRVRRWWRLWRKTERFELITY